MPLDFIVIMLGTNDIKLRYGPPTADQIKNNLDLMIEYIYANTEKVRPLVILPPPIGNEASVDFRNAAIRVAQLSNAISLLALERNIRAIDTHSILDLKTDMETDLIHLNQFGREKIADAVYEYFVGALQYIETDTKSGTLT